MSDAEASSALWRRETALADAAFLHLDVLVDGAVSKSGGLVLKARGEGDSHFAVFERASDAVAASVTLQRAIASTSWPHDTAVAVRVGVHTGEPLVRDDDYFGDVVNETARLRSLGHGGQILVSSISASLARYRVPNDIGFQSLGTFRIRDFRQPHEVFQVIAPDLPTEFAPLRALDSIPPPIAVVVRLDVVNASRVVGETNYAKVVDVEDRFARFVRRRFDECAGYGLSIAGDGVTASFGTPAAALDFLSKLQARLRPNGYEIRAGVHAGAVDVTPHGPTGPSLVIAADLLKLARPGEIIATRTIADLLLGADVRCEPHPASPRRILGASWELHTVTPSNATELKRP